MYYNFRILISFLLIVQSYGQIKDNYTINNKNFIKGKFESVYGEGWKFRWNLNDTPHRIFGKSISQNFDASDPMQSEIAANEFISVNQSLYNISLENLELWVNEQNGNIRYLIFNQIYKNIPVWNGRLDFRYRLNGDLVLLGHDAYPFISINTIPSIDRAQAIFHAQIHVGFNETLEDEIIDSPELYIWVEEKKEPIYHLAWLTELFIHSTDPDDALPIH